MRVGAAVQATAAAPGGRGASAKRPCRRAPARAPTTAPRSPARDAAASASLDGRVAALLARADAALAAQEAAAAAAAAAAADLRAAVAAAGGAPLPPASLTAAADVADRLERAAGIGASTAAAGRVPSSSPRDARARGEFDARFHSTSTAATPRDLRVLPRRIVLVRHAESQGNVDEMAYTIVPDPQVPLTERGESQARAAGDAVRTLFEADHSPYRLHVYMSPYKRSAQTAAAIAAAFPPGVVVRSQEDVQLREVRGGEGWGGGRAGERPSADVNPTLSPSLHSKTLATSRTRPARNARKRNACALAASSTASRTENRARTCTTA